MVNLSQKKDTVVPLFKKTYLAVIKNSQGSCLFQNFYAQVNGKSLDITRGGELSCAFFVSSITTLFKLSNEVQVTVNRLIKDLTKSGWKEISKPRVGAILVWEEKTASNEKHKHIGFYLGNDEAISNNAFEMVPLQHHWTFNGKRKVTSIFWHEKLK